MDDLMHIILEIPKSTIWMSVDAKVVDDEGTLQTMRTAFPLEDINAMRKDFLDNLYDDDYNATYVLTDKGRELLEHMEDDGK